MQPFYDQPFHDPRRISPPNDREQEATEGCAECAKSHGSACQACWEREEARIEDERVWGDDPTGGDGEDSE